MAQAKKLFRRMLLSNWGGIEHKILEFHEYVNLFSGKSGSGKSTVMDAMQVILYGSVRNDFLNRAADDTKNKRSVLSYLRGEQKDGTANRGNVDFCSQIVMEIEDTGVQEHVCVGVVFEVGKQDQDLKNYCFFSHTGRIPEHEYLTEAGVPYSRAQIKTVVEERGKEQVLFLKGNINRMYPSQESYRNTLCEVIFGGVEPGRFKTMEKSAIALRMSDGTGQFIKDYMFPKSKEDTIAAISEQLGAYREIKERVEDLEQKMTLLDAIQEHSRRKVNIQADQVRVDSLLRILEAETEKAHLAATKEELERIEEQQKKQEEQSLRLREKEEAQRNALVEVRAEIRSSDYGKKQEELKQIEEMSKSYALDLETWKDLVCQLCKWENTEEISDFVSNPTLQLLEEVCEGEISEEQVERLKQGLSEAFESIQEEHTQLLTDVAKMKKEEKEKREVAEELRQDRKPYDKRLRSVRKKLQSALSDRYQTPVTVSVFADLFDITDEDWKNAVEGRLGRIRFGLVTEPRYALEAAKILRKLQGNEYENITLINTAAICRDEPTAEKGTLYESVKTEYPYVDLCLKRYLGHIYKCHSVEELHEVRDGITKDCYAYSNYMFRHLRKEEYAYPYIGTRVSKRQLKELEEEILLLEEQRIAKTQEALTLKQVWELERLNNYQTKQLIRLAGSQERLEKLSGRADTLNQEMKTLRDGTRIQELQCAEQQILQEAKELGEALEHIQAEQIRLADRHGNLKKTFQELEGHLRELEMGFVPDPSLVEEVQMVLERQEAVSFKRQKQKELFQLKEQEEEETDQLFLARNQFNRSYPMYGFTSNEKENQVYDQLLAECRRDFQPAYKEEFENQCAMVYHSLRENVIASIHGEIKAAFRHRREINRMLAKIKFSDSIYQIDILPADDENAQFYEMLMAEELDMKLLGEQQIEGQMTFGQDAFYQKYEREILRLTEKFMPPRHEDPKGKSAHQKTMEKYADYRTYLKFSMYEKVVDENGNVKKNPVDEMAGRDSGGEGQNPKYVALLAGFAMLYMQQNNRESKIRLVLLDEAFSKMDKERSEVCLRYARELDLQLIVCVPDERLQSLIRNVDSVYGFRRSKNRISMMHIDKGNYLQMVKGDHRSV